MRPLILATTALVLTACQPRDASVSDAWIRLSAVPTNPSAAYFALNGGSKGKTLVSVSTPAAGRAEMHESMTSDGMMSMTPLKTVKVPAGGKVAFAPGGKHVMLYSVRGGTRPGSTIPLTFTFADGSKLTAQAKVVGAGDPAPE